MVRQIVLSVVAVAVIQIIVLIVIVGNLRSEIAEVKATTAARLSEHDKEILALTNRGEKIEGIMRDVVALLEKNTANEISGDKMMELRFLNLTQSLEFFQKSITAKQNEIQIQLDTMLSVPRTKAFKDAKTDKPADATVQPQN